MMRKRDKKKNGDSDAKELVASLFHPAVTMETSRRCSGTSGVDYTTARSNAAMQIGKEGAGTSYEYSSTQCSSDYNTNSSEYYAHYDNQQVPQLSISDTSNHRDTMYWPDSAATATSTSAVHAVTCSKMDSAGYNDYSHGHGPNVRAAPWIPSYNTYNTTHPQNDEDGRHQQQQQYHSYDDLHHYSQEEDDQNHLIPYTAETLLTFNNTNTSTQLSLEAAMEASISTHGHLHASQHLIDTAMSAPPICRHLLNQGCYRSDCQFSHFVGGHTCTFWIRNRCDKGDNCRFLHAFHSDVIRKVLVKYGMTGSPSASAPALKDHVVQSHQQEYNTSDIQLATEDAKRAARTMISSMNNLTLGDQDSKKSDSTIDTAITAATASSSHQKGEGHQLSTSHRQLTDIFNSLSPSSALFPTASAAPAWGSLLLASDESFHNHERTAAAAAATAASNIYNSADFNANKSHHDTMSFASIASRNVSTPPSNGILSTDNNKHTINSLNTKTSSKPIEYVRIPQELWTTSMNRDATAFHITDPIERYHAVNQRIVKMTCSTHCIMDLHFQSTKTALEVLAKILPEKLALASLSSSYQQRGDASNSSSRRKSDGTMDNDRHGVWIVTGSGHHIDTASHQRSGGVLQNAVLEWLDSMGYEYYRGKDRNGHTGAILVVGHGR